MRRFEVKVILERPNRLREVKRVFHVDVPEEEFAGLRKRDYYLYAKTTEIQVSAVELEGERLRSQYEETSYDKLATIAGIKSAQEILQREGRPDHVKA